MDIRVAPDPAGVAGYAAAAIAAWLGDAGPGAGLGLAGGSTPQATYRRLRDAPVQWTDVTAWLADERWVPGDHPDSNARMAREALFGQVPARLLEIEFDLGDPHAAAAAYERALGDVSLDVVLLGMGTDGHTASLFPGTAALDERERNYVANWVEAQSAWRLTATYPLLATARRIAFLVTGEAKADCVAAILGRGEDYPAGRVARNGAAVTWFLDAAAASQLDDA